MAWYNLSWIYRLPVTVDNTANATSALSYFQVGVSLTGSAYTSFHAHANSDGSDIRVTDSDGVTLLSHALEGIDTANSVVYILVKVPYIAPATTRTIYVYYGNGTATTVSSYATTVGPTTALIGPTDIFGQSDAANLNNNNVILRLRHQDQAGGGGSSLNGEFQCYVNNQATNSSVANCAIWQLRSTDGGVTWPTKTQILAPATNNAASIQSAQELANGNILLYYFYDLNTQYPLALEKGYVARSTDGGRTWTNLSTSPANPMTVPSGYTTPGALYGNAIEVTPGGDILKVWDGTKTGTATNGVYMLRCLAGSDPTNGSNWSLYGTIAYDGVNNFTETLGDLTTGTNMIAFARNDTVGTLYQVSSSNGGSTWGSPTALTGPNAGTYEHGAYSPWLLKLASGNILLFAGCRNHSDSAGGAAFWTSTDNGANWFDRPGQNPWNYPVSLVDAGYPGADQRADGTIVAACYHEVGGNPNTSNIGCIIFNEDYAFNGSNQYDACESFTAPWTLHEANITVDATHVHSGTNAIKGDNSGGHAVLGARISWPTDATLLPQGLAFSFWLYDSQNAGNISWSIKNAATTTRVACYVDGTGGTQHVEVYNGSAYIDSTVAAPLNQWNKHTVYANMPFASSTLTGTHAALNDATLTPTPGNGGAVVGAANRVSWQFGNEAANSNTTAWLDDFYTHQYTANPPLITVGAEGTNVATSYLLTAPTPASGVINVPSGLFYVAPNAPATGTITTQVVGGGLLYSSGLTFANGAAAQSFTITPTLAGVVTITTSNTFGLPNPSPVTYTATLPIVVSTTWNYMSTTTPGKFATGLSGTVGYTVYTPAGAIVTARTTSGITQIGSSYVAMVPLAFTGSYIILWDDTAGNFNLDPVAEAFVAPASGAYPNGITMVQALASCLGILSGLTSGGGLSFYMPDGVTRILVGTTSGSDRTSSTLTPPT